MPRKALVLFSSLLLLIPLIVDCPQAQAAYRSRFSLLAIYDAAREHDPKLASAQAEYRAQRESAPQARAQLLPQISVKGSGERTLERITRLPGQVAPIHQNYNQVQYGVQLSQPIVKPAAWYQLVRANDRVKAAGWHLRAAEQDLIARTTKLYFSVLKQQRELATARMAVRADRKRLQQVRREVQGGVASVLDVNQVKGELANDRVKEVRASGALQSAIARLQTLTDLPVAELVPLSSTALWLQAPLRSMNHWLDPVTQSNTQVLAAAARVRAAEAHAAATQAAHWPQLSLNASYQRTLTGQPLALGSNLPSSYRTRTATISLRLSMPLYSGGDTWSRQRQAKAQAAKRHEDYRQTYQKAVRTVRLNYRALVTDRQTLAASKQAVRAQHTAYQAAQMGYRAGTRNIVDVIQAQRDWFNAQQTRIESRYRFLIDWVKLRQASGTLSRGSLKHINHWLNATG